MLATICWESIKCNTHRLCDARTWSNNKYIIPNRLHIICTLRTHIICLFKITRQEGSIYRYRLGLKATMSAANRSGRLRHAGNALYLWRKQKRKTHYTQHRLNVYLEPFLGENNISVCICKKHCTILFSQNLCRQYPTPYTGQCADINILNESIG